MRTAKSLLFPSRRKGCTLVVHFSNVLVSSLCLFSTHKVLFASSALTLDAGDLVYL